MCAVIVERRTVQVWYRGPFRFVLIRHEGAVDVPRFHLTMGLDGVVLQRKRAETIEGLGISVPGEEG